MPRTPRRLHNGSTFPHSWLPLVAVALLATGCTQIENPGKVAPGSPTVRDTRSTQLQRTQFEDVPVPMGFEFVTRGNRSFSFDRGGVRVGRFSYWGRAPREEVVAFFRETLPLRAYRWEFLGEDRNADGTTLRFRKERQDCQIDISEDAASTRILVQVEGVTDS